ncbi:hypothetical protein V2H45_14700 [Tumidithrix elongata RA019]|uniref:Uncharacterized protein n=1 Tax=Tumidithrix elongata BACA0141 TaxID=2716417 RepID=A0AAW9PUQ9_9CYAN|nr:hypothetical protein [Tumidithrix elongata RA019]
MVIHKSTEIDGNNAKTRLLLALWDMGALESSVKKSGLTERVKRGKEKSGEYAPYLDALAEQGAISLITKGRNTQILLTELGKIILSAGLKNDDFAFGGNQVGSRVANALLKWMRQMGDIATAASDAPKISSYDEFKKVAIGVFDRLNRGYNLNDFVPIYRIRREFSESVDRLEFNDWMLKLQEENIFHLRTGGLEATDDQKQDSINDEYRGLLFVATKS